MSFLTLLLLASAQTLKVNVLDQGAFTSPTVQLAKPPVWNMNGVKQAMLPGDKAIKLTFDVAGRRSFPTLTLVDAPKPPRNFGPGYGFNAQPDRDMKHWVAWIPVDYPSSVRSLKLQVSDLVDHTVRVSTWQIAGLPLNAVQLPSIKATERLSPYTISATASFESFSLAPVPSVQVSPALPGDGWYLETRARSPFTSLDPTHPNSRFTETEYRPQFPSMVRSIDYKYPYLLDRIVLDGAATHFVEDTRELMLEGIRAKPSPTGQDWVIDGDQNFRSPCGIECKVTNNTVGWGYSGPPYRRALRAVIVIDPKTLNAAIEPTLRRYRKTSPDRIDVFAELVGRSPKRRGGQIVRTGLDTGGGYQAETEQGFGMLMTDDQIAPKFSIKLKIVRRIADQELPFHLVVPISKTSRFDPQQKRP